MMSVLLDTPLSKLIAKATGFKLSPAQTALIEVANGAKVENLKGEVQAAAIRALGYSEGPTRPLRLMFLNKGARGGGTLLSAYLVTYRALVASLDGLAPGEKCRVGFMSASMRQARAGLDYSKSFIRALGLGSLITSERLDSFTIKRDGHSIEFAVIRGNAGGDNLAGFWWAGLAVHEAAIASDPSSGATSLDLDAVEKSVRPRLLPPRGKYPGGILLEETTSRDAQGAAYDRVNDNHGNPDARIVVFKAPTLDLRPDDSELRAHVEAEREADPTNAAREFDTEWVSNGTSGHVFGTDLLEPCIVSGMSPNLTPQPGLEAFAAVDLGFVNDGSALCIVRKRPGDSFELAALRAWRPKKNQPLKPSEVIGAALDECERHGCRMLFSDVHHRAQLEEIASERKGIRIVAAPPGLIGKEKAHGDCQELLASKAFHMGHDPHLIRELTRITAIRTPDGQVKIRSPRRVGGHGDRAAAFVLALHAAFKFGGRGRDPAFQGGKLSLGMIQLGLIDSEGNRRSVSQGTEFAIGPDGRAYAKPASSYSPWAAPRHFGRDRGGF